MAVLDLVDILGPHNVYLSLYEDSANNTAAAGLAHFSDSVNCNSSIVAGHLGKDSDMTINPSTGHLAHDEAAYLARVRDRALRPLMDPSSLAYNISFDKLLYINNVIFDPIDAANLLFSTNLNETTGKTKYRAACAADFINPFQIQDSLATNDADGDSPGSYLFPWFSKAGNAASRQDVLDQRDAVRVRSCLGGMVAFNGTWFQPDGIEETMAVAELTVDHNATMLSTRTVTATSTIMVSQATVTALDVVVHGTGGDSGSVRRDPHRHIPAILSGVEDPTPKRFRNDCQGLDDISTCCLAHEGFASAPRKPVTGRQESDDAGIYMNPYIRVARDKRTLRLLRITRRFERLFTPFNFLVRTRTKSLVERDA